MGTPIRNKSLLNKIMKKIWVFGDSFVAPDRNRNASWPDILSELLNLPLVNRGVSGSSTEYSIKQFTISLWQHNICDDDIVIFSCSNVGRMHFDYQNIQPHTAVWKDINQQKNTELGYEWFRDNKKYIDWYYANIDLDSLSIAHQGYTHILKNFAETRSGPVILLTNFSQEAFSIPLGNIPNNFLHPDIQLFNISEAELYQSSYTEWTKWSGCSDLRVNHLSIPNLKILAQMMKDAIQNLDIGCLTYDQFKQNILTPITNEQQYQKYIECGLLYPSSKL
jgi:hypothetical protein